MDMPDVHLHGESRPVLPLLLVSNNAYPWVRTRFTSRFQEFLSRTFMAMSVIRLVSSSSQEYPGSRRPCG